MPHIITNDIKELDYMPFLIIFQFCCNMISFVNNYEINLDNKLLFVSSLSVGSVGTIALDNLIANNKFERIGYLNTKALEPTVGLLHQQIQHQTLGLPSEFYLNGDILILQFRSRIRKGRKKQLVQQIKSLNDKYKFTEIIFLSSLSFSSRPDIQILSNKRNIYYSTKGQTSLRLQGATPLSNLITEKQSEQQSELLESSGLAEKALQSLEKVTVLFMFSTPIWDSKSGQLLSKEIRKVCDRKEISRPIDITY